MSEFQALDRIYRLGQTKEVGTIRYIMRGSYEEQVLQRQRRKQELAGLMLSNGGISKGSDLWEAPVFEGACWLNSGLTM